MEERRKMCRGDAQRLMYQCLTTCSAGIQRIRTLSSRTGSAGAALGKLKFVTGSEVDRLAQASGTVKDRDGLSKSDEA